ncbi:MAG: hypothetical protein WBW33_14960 [Bryobacteraceae bacterium]
MSDLSSKVPEIPGTVTNEEARANQEPASKETNSVPREQSAPPEPTKQNQEPAPTNEKTEKDASPEVDARTAANRINAQKSTGAKTPEGRAASSRNAVKHGLFAADITQYFRNDDESQRYQRFVDGLVKDLDPVGDLENVLARRAADIQFRLEMLRTAEFKVYAGNTGLVNDTMEELLNRSGNPMGLASLYDSRFQRAFSKTMEDLRRAQQSRRDKELHALEQLKGIALAHIQQDTTFDPAKFGFVISRDFVFNQAHCLRPRCWLN